MTNMYKVRSTQGFTLLEIIVVVAIIAILAAYIAPKVTGRVDDARISKAKSDIRVLESSLELYKLDNFKYPATSDGLKYLVGSGSGSKGYIERLPKDPWGQDYQYQYPGQHMDFDIWSFGADGQSGGTNENQDVGNWNIDEVK